MFPITLIAALAAGALAQTSVFTDSDPKTPVPGFSSTITAFPQVPQTTASALPQGPQTTTVTEAPATTVTPEFQEGTTTIHAYIPDQMTSQRHTAVPDTVLAGSVITADACGSTVISIGCRDSNDAYCQYHAGKTHHVPQGTLTLWPSSARIEYSTTRDGANAFTRSTALSCNLQSQWEFATKAQCSGTTFNSLHGQKAKPQTIKPTDKKPGYTVLAITAGASKLPTAAESCSQGLKPRSVPTPTGGKGVTKTDKTGAAVPTGVLEIKKVVVPLVLAAGAGALF